jgi:elongation factor 1-alpha
MADTEKQHISLVVCGHVDAGKSTTTGHLIFKLGGISERDMEKLQKEADEKGKSSFAFAYYMDRDKAEREKGVTINCTTKEFYTDKYHYTIVDAPGHKDYIKNMINGAGCADVALLLVPAETGGFEAAIAKGDRATGEVMGQTRQHCKLLSLLGIEQIIVGINKMDSVNWDETRFNEIKGEFEKMVKTCGFPPKKVAFIPYSGFKGHNLVDRYEGPEFSWYKGWSANLNKDTTITGYTLYDALDKLVQPPKRFDDKDLLIPINGIYKIKGVGDVITGRIEQGTLNAGDVVNVCPRELTGLKVFTIEMHHKTWPNAKPGDNVGMNIKGLDKNKMPKVGDVMYLQKNKPIFPVKRFKIQFSVMDHPGELKVGFAPCAYVRTGKSACKMTEIVYKMGKDTGGSRLDNPPFIKVGDTGEAWFEPQLPIFLTTYDEVPGLGRIAIMDSNYLVMVGKVLEVEYKEELKQVKKL